jgi:hypothetical protein
MIEYMIEFISIFINPNPQILDLGKVFCLICHIKKCENPKTSYGFRQRKKSVFLEGIELGKASPIALLPALCFAYAIWAFASPSSLFVISKQGICLSVSVISTPTHVCTHGWPLVSNVHF